MAVLTVLAILGFGYVFMCLWNWLMPAIFGLGMITFWQGIGLLILGKMLFGGFRSKWGRGGCGYGHCGHGGYHRSWKNKWQEKMMSMSPEEREKFKAKVKERCGYDFLDQDVEKPKE